ncbi:MAG: hypothetical protein RIT27_1858 [Pseudomonadota bacterium]|jgi:hypothetical protein
MILRQQIAEECARLMVQEFIEDFRIAKQKAAAKFGISNRHDLPTNIEIEIALQNYQRLFQKPDHLLQLRKTAISAMQLFEKFQPRLVGKVLNGTANPHSAVNLHLFSDNPEEVAFFLIDRKIPYTLTERQYTGISKSYPCYQFIAGNHKVTLTIFNVSEMRQAPPDPISNKPMRRANLTTVSQLIS